MEYLPNYGTNIAGKVPPCSCSRKVFGWVQAIGINHKISRCEISMGKCTSFSYEVGMFKLNGIKNN